MPTIHAVDPHDDAAMRAWYDALHAGSTADRAAPLLSGYDSFTFTMRHPGQVRRRLPVAARVNDGEPDDGRPHQGQVVGAMLVELPLLHDTGTVQVEIAVPPPHRGRGVGAALWSHAVELARREGRTVAQTEVSVPRDRSPGEWPGARFAAARGFTTGHVEDHQVLDLPVPDERPAGNPAGSTRTVQWAGPCPEEHVRTYAALQTAMNADVPTGAMTRTAVEVSPERVRTSDARLAESYLTLVTLVLDDHAGPVGYTLLLVPHAEPGDAVQDDTLVLRAHRGRGLGATLKAANLRLLAAHSPGTRRVHTWVAQSNAPMQAVNAAFGFRDVETLHEMECTL